MKLINNKFIEIAPCNYDDASGSFIRAPDVSSYGKLRFATVIQAPQGASVHGVTPLTVGDQVVLATSWEFGRWRNIVPASDVLGFWHAAGGRVNIVPAGERCVVESGYFVSSDEHYGCSVDDLPRGCGLIQEVKLGEHCVLRAVSVGSRRYNEMMPGINRRCYIEHLGSHGDITVVMFGRKALLFVPVSKVQGVTCFVENVHDGVNRVLDFVRRN
jgi:hypothetical protein